MSVAGAESAREILERRGWKVSHVCGEVWFKDPETQNVYTLEQAIAVIEKCAVARAMSEQKMDEETR